MQKLPSAFPLFNAYLYNIVQSFLVIFIVTDIPRREKSSGTLDCLHVHPFDNRHYWIGKITGICALLFLFNLASLAIGWMLNTFVVPTPVRTTQYLFYLLTLNIPTLVFMVGIAAFTVRIIKIPFLATGLLVAFWGCTITFLPDLCHGLLDCQAHGVPNIFSDVTGHVGLKSYLWHRSAYLLAGIGLLMAGTRVIVRTPNNKRQIRRVQLGGELLLLAAAGIIGGSWLNIEQEKKKREDYRQSFAKHWQPITGNVREHHIAFRQQGKQVRANSKLTIANNNERDIKQIVLFLNPGLKIENIHEKGRPIPFERENQVVIVKKNINARDSVSLQIEYAGEIEELVCQLEQPEKERLDSRRGDYFLRFGKAGCIVDKKFLLLTPAACWYPTTIPSENPLSPFESKRDFTRFRLKVIRPQHPVTLSQGKNTKRKDTLFFTPAKKLSGISLCGGEFQMKQLKIRNWSVRLFHFPEHDFFSKLKYRDFEKKKEILKELAIQVERQLNFQLDNRDRNNPGVLLTPLLPNEIPDLLNRQEWYDPETRHFALVETPVEFQSAIRPWNSRSENVQPGMAFLPEWGAGMHTKMNLFCYKEVSIQLITSIFSGYNTTYEKKTWLHYILTYPPDQVNMIRNSIRYVQNPLNIYATLFEPQTVIEAPGYPLLNFVLKQMIQTTLQQESTTGNSKTLYHTLQALRGKTIQEAIESHAHDAEYLKNITQWACSDLRCRIFTVIKREDFLNFLHEFYARNKGAIPADSLFNQVQKRFGVDIQPILDEWLQSRHEAAFKVKHFTEQTYYGGYKGTLEVTNDGKEDGIFILCLSDFNNPRYQYTRLKPGETKKIRFECRSERSARASYGTGLARNFPTGERADEIAGRSKWTKKQYDGADLLFEITDVAPDSIETLSNEIIVDNLDPGFRVIQHEKNLATRLAARKKTTLHGDIENNVQRWTQLMTILGEGHPVKGFHYKMGGDGKSKAIWETTLPETGKYRVMVYMQKFLIIPHLKEYSQGINFKAKEEVTYHYTISHANEEKQIAFKHQSLYYKVPGHAKPAGEWVSIGTFDFPAGKTTLTLDDRGTPNTYIIADAVKWVRVEE